MQKGICDDSPLSDFITRAAAIDRYVCKYREQAPPTFLLSICAPALLAVHHSDYRTMSSPPKYQEMDRDGGPKLLASHESLFVKQTKRGCIKELLGCEATNEFKIYPSQAEVMLERNTYSSPLSACSHD